MRILSVFLFLSVAVVFQNCSKVGFNAGSPPTSSVGAAGSQSETSTPGEAFGEIYQGLKGGHFDLDTSSQAYPLSAGSTDHHVHEYDDKYNVTYADYFHLLDSKFGNINEIVTANSRFVLIIANAQLSRGGIVSINGQSQSVLDYQKRVESFLAGNTSALDVFTLSGISDKKLAGLKIGFSADAIVNGGLIGTQTSCVVKNNPGKLGEYRNGALVIQAIAIDQLRINPATKTADLNGGLLWESTIFWHSENGCYQ